MSTPPQDSNDGELDKLIEELEKQPEESDIIVEKQIKNNLDEKKPIVNPYKDKKNDDWNNYEFSDDKEESDDNW